MAEVRFAAAEIKAVGSDGPGEWEAIISDSSLDRDGEVVAKGAFNPLPKAIPIHVDHRMDSEGLVGTGRPYYTGDELRLKGVFAGTPRAQIIRQLVTEGHLGSMSVGFMDAKRVVKDGIPTIERAELLEASFVTVPSNRDAIVVAAKSLNLPTAADTLDDAVNQESTAADPDEKAAAPAAADDRPAEVNVAQQALAEAARATAVIATTA